MRKLRIDEMNRLKLRDFQQAEKSPLILILDDIRSAGNVGSLFRTADAFRLEEIILCGITACPPHKEIQKTALGATDSVKWTYVENVVEAIEAIKQKGPVFALEQTTDSILLQNLNEGTKTPRALVLGNEVQGVSERALSACEGAIEIPQFGTKHSFNVTISAGIAIWEILKSQLPK